MSSLNQPRRLYIDSDDRVTGTHADFEVDFAGSILGCVAAEPVGATIPLTCYPIPAYEQYLYFKWAGTLTGGLQTQDVQLRAKLDTNFNYTSLTLLVNQLNFAIANYTVRMDTMMPVSVTGVLFTVGNPDSKLSFTSTLNLQFTGYMDLGKTGLYYHNLSYRLGFANPLSAGTWYNSSTLFAAAFPDNYVFASILRTTSIYISCSLAQGDSMTTSDAGNRDLLVKIPVDSGVQGAVVQYTNNMKDRTVLAVPSTFRRVRVRLLDDEKMPLDLAPTGKGTVQLELRCFYD